MNQTNTKKVHGPHKKSRTARPVRSNLRGGPKTGSTRVRVFKALARVSYPVGLSVAEVRAVCGLDPTSGHVLSLVVEEVNRGRFHKWVEVRNGRPTNVYCLSPAGREAFESRLIDFTKFAGRGIGVRRGR